MKKKKVIIIIACVLVASILLGLFYFLKIEWKSKFEVSKIKYRENTDFLNLNGQIRNKTNSNYRFVYVTVQLTNGSSTITKDIHVGEVKANETKDFIDIMSEKDALGIDEYIPEKVLQVKFGY